MMVVDFENDSIDSGFNERYKLKYDFSPIDREATLFEKRLSSLEQVRYVENPKNFYKETAFFKKIDGKLSHFYQFSQIKSNSFLRGSGHLTTGFDFYKGSFHGQMIRALINYCNLKQGSSIMDIFCGSGTTLIEASLLGFDSVGLDINPIACLNSLVKSRLLDTPTDSLVRDNEKYFNPSYYDKFKNTANFNHLLGLDIKELYYLFLYFRALANRVRFSMNISTAIRNNFAQTISVLKSFEQLREIIDFHDIGKSHVFQGDNIEYLKTFKPNSIDAIITSPPYYDLIDYIQEDIIQLSQIFPPDKIANLKRSSIGNRNDYWIRINSIFPLIHDILKPDSQFIIILGDQPDLKKRYLKIARNTRFIVERTLKRDILNHKKKPRIEHVLIIRKEP